MKMKRLLPLLVLLALQSSALAAPTSEQEARALFKEGNRLRDAKDYEGALEMYRAAYEKLPSPNILVNMAATYVYANKPADAANTYEKLLNHEDLDPKLKPEIQKTLDALDVKLAKIAIEVTDQGAKIYLDNKEIGTGPMNATWRVEPGAHRVTVSKPGLSPSDTDVAAKVGQTHPVKVTLSGGKPVDPDWTEKPKDTDTTDTDTTDTDTTDTDVADADTTDGDVEGEGDGEGDDDVTGISKAAGPRLGSFGATGLFLIDGDVGRGGAALVGVRWSPMYRLSILGAGILGPTMGGHVGASYAIFGTTFQPTVSAGVSFFSVEGLKPAFRVAAGIQYVASSHLAFVLDLGFEVYSGLPEEYASSLFVPAIGVHAGF
jgi:tetratricopeptide (TPR) repeat protein